MRAVFGFLRLLAVAALIFTTAGQLAAQSVGTLTGRVVDEDGTSIVGAQIVVKSAAGYEDGTLTGENGRYRLEGVPAGGPYRVEAVMLGFSSKAVEGVRIGAGQTRTADFILSSQAVALKEISVFATRAEERKTPVAFTDMPKIEIARKLASRDVPMVLNTTPGVYATMTGGGAGDSRINVRGFNQRNVAVMINGVPVNDMENGWVYWSNWDGLGDATSSIQIQRGMGTSNLAVPSIGGTINVLTDAAAIRRGGTVKQEYGSGGFLKTTMALHSGLVDDRFAASFVGVRKTQDGSSGLPEQLWSDAWAYFGALSYQLNDRNRVQAFLVGAPQQHAQRRSRMRVASWDRDYAGEIGVNVEDAASYTSGYPAKTSMGREFNMNWGNLNAPAAALREYYNDGVHDVRDPRQLDETVNYFHKPQANVNWYFSATDKLSLTNVLYLSLGKGGGTGGYGSRFGRTAAGQVDWQAVYDKNSTNVSAAIHPTEKRSTSILRNSVNRHTWYGWIGTAAYQALDNVKLTGGVDARMYEGNHWREVRNLIGGEYFVDTDRKGKCIDKNETANCVRRLGDKIAYHNDGEVKWYGVFGQADATFGKLSAITSFSTSRTEFRRTDFFLPKQADGSPAQTDWVARPGYKLTGGLNYNITEAINVFGSAGYISKPSNYNGIFTFTNQQYDPLYNEQVNSAEIGAAYRTPKFAANVALYNTLWQDRSWNSRFFATDGKEYSFLLRGIDARHKGVEVEARFKPIDIIEFNASASIGDWRWLNDVETTYTPDDNPAAGRTFVAFVKDLRVGDAAQKSFALSTSITPTEELYIDVVAKHFDDYYSDFDPSRRTNAKTVDEGGDRGVQSWKTPAYTLLDLHAGYTLPYRMRNSRAQLVVNVQNLLDEVYISDSNDGSKHNAATAEVFMGLPRSINAGLKLSF